MYSGIIRRLSRGYSGCNTHKLHSTTVLNVRKRGEVVMVGDGQVSLGPTVFKTNAVKVRRILPDIICGFAGTTADCMALLELIEKEFELYPHQTLRVCLNIAKEWRMGAPNIYIYIYV